MGGMGLSGLVFGLVALVGAMGLPLSMPPLPPDPVVLRAAPEDCIFYLGWAGNAQPNAASANRTEQILASPEVRRLVSEFGTQFDSALQQVARGKPGGESVTNMTSVWSALLTHPTAIYVSKVAPSDQGLQFSGGLVCNLGADAAAITEKLNKVRELSRARAPGGTLKTTTIGGIEFETQPGPPSGPELLLGLKDSLLIFATGADEAQALVTRLQGSGPPPKWYQELQQKLLIERLAVTSYLNFERLLQSAGPAVSDPDVMSTLEALGLAQITSIGSASGLKDAGATSKTLFATRGEPQGLLGLLGAKPLTLDELNVVPREVTYSVIVRLDPAELFQKIRHVIEKLDPWTGNDLRFGLEGLEVELDLNLVEDLLKPLGDSWTLSIMPAGGPMPGTAIIGTATLDDRAKFAASLEKIVELIKAVEAAERENQAPNPVKLTETMIGQVKVYSLASRDFGPFTPAWCLTDKHFVMAANPSLVEQFLKRDPAAPTLAGLRPYQVLFPLRAPSVVTYQDTMALYRQLYPLAQFFGPMAMTQLAPMGIQVKMPTLPNPESLAQNITPNVSLSGRHAGGVLIERYFSVPLNVDLTTAAPAGVALVLPAVQSARATARQMKIKNQLMQIAIADLMYNDAKKVLPPRAIMSKDGKPLLSWRVAVLRYLGEGELYDQFHRDEPWDSEHNRKLIERMPEVYAHAGSPELNRQFKTRFLVPSGAAALFSEDKGPTLAQITDGTSHTILGVVAGPDKAVIWTKPDDLEVDPNNPLAGLAGDPSKSFMVMFADGSARALSESIDPELLRRLFNPRDGKPVNLPDDSPRKATQQPDAMNNMRQLGVAMHAYCTAYERFPTSAIADKDGKPLLSWRVAILPYVDEQALYEQFHLDEPWDSEHNRALIEQMPAVYAHPDSPELNGEFKTRFVLPTGEAAMFSGGKSPGFRDIRDGLSQTLMGVAASPDQAVVWSKPGDLAIDPKNPAAHLAGNPSAKFVALFADGAVRMIDEALEPEVLRRLFNPRDGQPVELPK